jgi:hypothetical protein
MRLSRICSIILFALLFVARGAAQERACTTKLADLKAAAELRGFHLGMTTEEVKVRVPQVAFGRKDDLGVSKTSISPDFDPRIDKTNFADVRTVSFDFLDGRLMTLWVGFDNTFKWKTVDDFVKGISDELALPDGWTIKGRAQQIQCADFQLTVSPIGGAPSLRIADLTAEETILARRQAKEDATTAAEAAGPEQHPVVGDARNKIYYPADCEALKTVPEKSRQSFESKGAAEQAGYKRAANCP